MPDHIWTVVCQGATVDDPTGRLSLFNVIEQLTAAEAPEEWPVEIQLEHEVVSYWVRSDPDTPERAEARLVAEWANQERHPFPPYEMDLEAHSRYRHRYGIATIKLIGWGRMWFVTEIKDGDAWKEVGRVPLDIRLEPPSKS